MLSAALMMIRSGSCTLIPQHWRCLSLLRLPAPDYQAFLAPIEGPLFPLSHPRSLPLRAHGQTPRRLITVKTFLATRVPSLCGEDL